MVRYNLLNPLIFTVACCILGCGDESRPREKSVDQNAAEDHKKMHQVQLNQKIVTISALPGSTKSKDVATACNEVQATDLPAELKVRCAKAHLLVAREEFKNGYVKEGSVALDRAVPRQKRLVLWRP